MLELANIFYSFIGVRFLCWRHRHSAGISTLICCSTSYFLFIFISDTFITFYYLFWSTTKAINFFRCLRLIDIKYVQFVYISYEFLSWRVTITDYQFLASSYAVTYEHSVILLLQCPCLCCHSFVWDCVVFYSGIEYVQLFSLFVYICIAIGKKLPPIIKRKKVGIL